MDVVRLLNLLQHLNGYWSIFMFLLIILCKTWSSYIASISRCGCKLLPEFQTGHVLFHTFPTCTVQSISAHHAVEVFPWLSPFVAIDIGAMYDNIPALTINSYFF